MKISARRVKDIGNNIIFQLNEKTKRFEYFSISFDESIDVNYTSQCENDFKS